MLLNLSLAIIEDLTRVLKLHEDFMGKSKEDKVSIVHEKYGQTYSAAVTEYMVTVDEDQFMSDVKAVIDLGNDEIDQKAGIFEALGKYLSQEFCFKLDDLNSAFFFEDLEVRKEKLHHLFPGKSVLHATMKDVMIEGTYQEVAEEAYSTLKRIKEISTILIQTPVELGKEIKKEIREKYSEAYPYSFCEFQINPQVLGGMRVFIDGKVMDDSWLNKIQKLSSFTIQLSK